MRTRLRRPRRDIHQLVKPPAYPFEFFLISKDGNKVKSSNGPFAAPDWDFERARREPLDLLMIPGGEGTRPLLDGLPAATNHAAFAWVVPHGPKVLWDRVARWVDAGKYVTSAGVSAGTDMAFHLVDRLAGRAVAEVAAKQAEYDWHRDPQEPIFYPEQAAVPTSFPSS